MQPVTEGPAWTGGLANVSVFAACNCNGHAYDCYYDPEVDRHKASKSREEKFEGGGVCIDCQVGLRSSRGKGCCRFLRLVLLSLEFSLAGGSANPLAHPPLS